MLLKSLISVIILHFIFALDVGDECAPSEDVSDGICTIITDCEVAVRLIKNKVHHHLTRCGFSGDLEIICCPRTTNKYGSSTETSTRSLRIADRECQKILETSTPPLNLNILNGEVSSRGEFPHMVALGYPQDDSDTNFNFDCGGSLISSTFVLTAAHCVDTLDRIEPSIVRVGVVELGSSQRNDEFDVNIKNITVHPSYLKREKYHDLALIRLGKPVEFNSYQSPACLYTDANDPDKPLTITGWGTTSTATSARSNVLLKANVQLVARDKCVMSYLNWRKLPQGIADNQICAGDPEGLRDTCQGDSGGPLQGLTSTTDETYRLVGITSFGRGCGSVPGVYTRVSQYIDWIEGIVWRN